jgi:hypothetical protein
MGQPGCVFDFRQNFLFIAILGFRRNFGSDCAKQEILHEINPIANILKYARARSADRSRPERAKGP